MQIAHEGVELDLVGLGEGTRRAVELFVPGLRERGPPPTTWTGATTINPCGMISFMALKHGRPGMSLCSKCGEGVQQGALRCRRCSAAFRGSRAISQVRLVLEVRPPKKGVWISIGVTIEDALLD